MKQFKIILFLVLLVSLYSCSDDFLDKNPLAQPSSEILYTTPDGIEELTNAVYAQMRSPELSQFGWFVGKEVGSDDTNPGSNAGDAAAVIEENFSNFDYLTTQPFLYGFWRGNYTLIARANLVVEHAPNVEFSDDALKSRLIAESKFLRALAYFNLVRGWGGVPLITKVPENPEKASNVVPRSTKEEIYVFLEEQLSNIIDDLPNKSEYPQSEAGRITKGAAQTLLAQVYLYQKKYDECLEQSLAVINSGEYQLFDSYVKISNPNYENGAGSIFEVQYTYRSENDLPNAWQLFQGVRGTGSGYGFFSPSADLADSYDMEDPRREYNIYFEGEPWPYSGETDFEWAAGTDPRANQKTMLPRPFPPGFAAHSPLNRTVLRYADVLLMAAECENELGNTGQALEYLEMIRSRAREGHDILPEITANDPIELRHLIWEERRWELALEGYRAYDIRRYNDVEPGFAEELYQSIGKDKFTASKHLLYPIPQAELDYDTEGVLTQNPGW